MFSLGFYSFLHFFIEKATFSAFSAFLIGLELAKSGWIGEVCPVLLLERPSATACLKVGGPNWTDWTGWSDWTDWG